MKNTSSAIPIGMMTKKFYCHKCGEPLRRHPKTRTVRPGDADYREHSRLNHRTRMVGAVEVTEYDFQCPSCGDIIAYEEQCILRYIQKQLRKNTLSEGDILDNREKAENAMGKKTKLYTAVFAVVAFAFLALVFYLKIKAGNNSFTFYF